MKKGGDTAITLRLQTHNKVYEIHLQHGPPGFGEKVKLRPTTQYSIILYIMRN